jgi:membrane protein implicated in regulation of membrane protease activity
MGVLSDLSLFLHGLSAWHWLALGAVLLAVEIASTTFYLLWPGIAALLVGLLQFAVPAAGGAPSVLLFAVLAVAATVAWKRSPLGRAVPTAQTNLNARMSTYLGRQGVAAHDFVGGHGAILLDDTRWSATLSDGPQPRGGDMLQVVGADGAVLRVRPVTVS